MISCKKATALMSKSKDESLSFSETLQLKVHLFICEFCEKYRQQLDIISLAVRRLSGEETDGSKTPPAPQGAKERLLDKLKQIRKD